MFSQILNAFQGFFSRAFWFGNFLPVAVVAAMHLVLVEVTFPGALPVTEWLSAGAADALTSFTLLVAVLVVLAYALSPMVPLVRELLDGRLLPNGIHFALRRGRVIAWHRRQKGLDSAKALYGKLHSVKATQVPRLQKERATGAALRTASDDRSIAAAQSAIRRFRDEMRFGREPEPASAQAACDALATALAANDSDYAGPSSRDRSNAETLTDLHMETVLLLRRATADAGYRFDRFGDLASPLDLDKYQATRVGDARWLSERYAQTAYSSSHDYLWPRLQIVLGEQDEGFPKRLGDAQSMIEFSVLALTLFLTVPVVWLPLLIADAVTPWLFLGIGIATPFVLGFLYEMVVQSQNAFGRTVRGAIDHYRLTLLTKTLRQPMPATLSAERVLWGKLLELERGDNTVDLAYSRETGGEAAE